MMYISKHRVKKIILSEIDGGEHVEAGTSYSQRILIYSESLAHPDIEFTIFYDEGAGRNEGAKPVIAVSANGALMIKFDECDPPNLPEGWEKAEIINLKEDQ